VFFYIVTGYLNIIRAVRGNGKPIKKSKLVKYCFIFWQDSGPVQSGFGPCTLRDMLAASEEVIADYRAIGCAYIVIPYLAEEDRSTGPHYEEIKKGIRRLCEEAKQQGLVMLYHNHEFEFAAYNGKYALDDLFDSIPRNSSRPR
jgi:hypothetical protein